MLSECWMVNGKRHTVKDKFSSDRTQTSAWIREFISLNNLTVWNAKAKGTDSRQMTTKSHGGKSINRIYWVCVCVCILKRCMSVPF